VFFAYFLGSRAVLLGISGLLAEMSRYFFKQFSENLDFERRFQH